jgi:uncharacterized protein (TIGR04141 family)
MTRPAAEKKERENLSLGISLINEALFDDPCFDNIIMQLMSESLYTPQPLRRIITRDRSVRLFYRKEPKPVKWLSYFVSALGPEATMRQAKNSISSFICFIGSGESTFVMSGGLGKFEIQEWLDPQFGMNILIRLLPKDAPRIRAIQDLGVTGSVLGESRFYRGKQRLTDEDQFGKIYSQINAELNKAILIQKLGFSESEIKKGTAGCWAKSSFQLSKSLSFARTQSLIDKLAAILQEDQPYSINSVRLIRPRGDSNKTLIQQLNQQLVSTLYEDCRQNRIPNFDFCHTDFESYLTASKFIIRIGGKDDFDGTHPPTLSEIIKHFKDKDRWLIENVREFELGFLEKTLITYDENELEATKGNILHHFHGEVLFEQSTYFYLDRQWFWIEDIFIEDLNKQCQVMIGQCLEERLIDKRFDISRSEGLFNDQFLGQTGWLLLDTITADNIEACDALHFNEHFAYFVHVKKGFNNAIRELASQVHLAARRIAHDKLGGYSYISAIEDQARENHQSNNTRLKQIATQRFPPGGLKEMLRSKNPEQIVFCLAFVDTGSQERSIKTQLGAFRSNIAKFSLLKLSRDIRQYGFQFKVIQIMRP